MLVLQLVCDTSVQTLALSWAPWNPLDASVIALSTEDCIDYSPGVPPLKALSYVCLIRLFFSRMPHPKKVLNKCHQRIKNELQHSFIFKNLFIFSACITSCGGPRVR